MNVAQQHRTLNPYGVNRYRYRVNRYRLIGVLVLLVMVVSVVPATPQPPANNPIVVENQQTGSSGWVLTMQGDDATGQIKGYASATSVNQNQTITFYVSVNPAQTYTIDFYRFGWYAGLGARLRSHVGPISGVQQPPCNSDPNTGLLECNWNPSYTLTVPGDWTSGVYAAKLTNAQGDQNYVIFVVKDGRPAPLLYQAPLVTDQAYNDYPNDGRTGKSLYGFNSYGANTVSGNTAAVKVSFDRPMANAGLGNFITWDINILRWLERSGYDVTYATDLDLHANGVNELLTHKALLSIGHDEYWSKEMRDAAEAGRDAGVSLAFFGANASFTQVRFESSSTGAPDRVVVEYRNYPWAPTDPVQGPTTTTDFRQPPVSRPEQTMVGVQFIATMANTDYVVTNSSHWVYAGTGFHDGDVVKGILGYEADALFSTYPPPSSTNQTLLSQSPFTDVNGKAGYANSSIYQAPSGAWVFAVGTLSWAWALDDVPGLNHNLVDARIQQTTANALNAFLNGAQPTITSFSPASGPVGTSVTISGTNFTGATAVTFNGRAASFTVTSATAIQATVPAGASTGPVSVTTPGGTATSATSFTVIRPPTITTFTPTSGLAGTSVTISGTNFTGATAVTFNGVAASFTVISPTAIQTTVPPAATTGPLGVTTPVGSATSVSAFTMKFRLTVTKTGLLASGIVTSSPAGIDCGSTCSAAIDSGTVVSLKATPTGLLSIFIGWKGCDTVSGTVCTVTMGAARAVVANFLP
jgi:hypothetical protein